jgi:hypothetical protein
MSTGQADDDWIHETPIRVKPPITPAEPTGKGRPGRAPLIILGQFLCLGVGAYSLLMMPAALRIIGYLACGLVLPVLWALVFVEARKAEQAGNGAGASRGLLQLNQILLWVGFAVAMMCARTWAIEVTK